MRSTFNDFARNLDRDVASTRDDEMRYIYLKLPFINEEFKRRAQAVVRRSGISNIRLQYSNSTPSAREFAPPKQKLNCMEECETCKSGKKSNQCLRKNAVYEGRYHERFFSAKCEIFRLFLLICDYSNKLFLLECSQFKRNRRNISHFAEKKRSWNQVLKSPAHIVESCILAKLAEQ